MGLFNWLFRGKGLNAGAGQAVRTKNITTYAPEGIGFQDLKSLRYLEDRFNVVIRNHESYWANVKQRVMQEHPELSEPLYSWLMFEFKRFLAMNVFLNNVGMYSPLVDRV